MLGGGSDDLLGGVCAIEDGRSLLEGAVLGLDDDCARDQVSVKPWGTERKERTEVQEDTLEDEPDAVHDVVLPVDGRCGQCVSCGARTWRGNVPRAMGLTYWLKMSASEIVKLKMVNPFARMLYGRISSEYVTMRGVKARLPCRQRRDNGKIEALCSLVRGVVEEDKRDDGVRRRRVPVDLEPRRADGLQREEERHEDDRGQEEQTATETLDHGRRGERPREIPDCEDTVDE
jgi:hypothetical protein